MSKAFTKESDDARPSALPPRELPLPHGTPNYVTPAGAARYADELAEQEALRPAIAGEIASAPDDAARNALRERLAEIDRRLLELRERIERAEIVDRSDPDASVVRFGAFVTIANDDGAERTFRIVGVDEADVEKHYVSWISPLAKALIGHGIGDRVTLRSPGGVEEVEVVGIRYE